MSPSVQHPALAHGRPGVLATTADRPGQEGLPARPLATGCWQLVPNICFFFTWSEGAPVTTSYRDHDATCSFGRSRADSRPQPVSMLTISHISRGNLGPAAPPAAHPAAASLRPIVQSHRPSTAAGARADTRLKASLITSRRPEADRKVKAQAWQSPNVAGAELQDHSGPWVPRVLLHSTVVTVGGFPVKTSCSITATRRS